MPDSNQHSTPFDSLDEFIKFAEEWAASRPDFGPMFYRDAARLGRGYQSLEEQFEVSDTFARVADAYCWDSATTTHDDLMNARAEWQTRIGMMRLAALGSNPARSPNDG